MGLGLPYGQGPFGGLLTAQLGVIGPLSVPRRVCGPWASLWSGVVRWVVDCTTRGYRTAVGTAARLWALGFPMVRGRSVGCWLHNSGLSDRCRHRLLAAQLGVIGPLVGTVTGG